MSGPRPLRAPSKRDASKLPTSTRGAYLLDAAAAVPGTAPVFASLLARRAAQVHVTFLCTALPHKAASRRRFVMARR